MSREYFYILLVAYAFVVAINFTEDWILSLKDKSPRKREICEYLKTKPKLYRVAVMLIFSVTVIAGVVGYIGMYFFWPLSPFIYFTSIATKLFYTPFFPVRYESSSLERTCIEIELFLDGVLMTLIFFGSAKTLFFH
jgi:hypothetical protein